MGLSPQIELVRVAIGSSDMRGSQMPPKIRLACSPGKRKTLIRKIRWQFKTTI